MKHRRKKPQHGVHCEEKLFTSLPSRGDDTFLPEDWPTLAEVLAAAEMTWGTFDKESVRWKRCTKIQALYEAAVLEATGKDDESQVARLRLLLEQIMSLTGLGPPSSSGATSETAGGPTGVSLGEAQPSQGDHGRSERVPPRWLAPTAKWAAAPAGKTAPRRSSPSEPQDKRRRRLADPPPELGHCANPRVFPRPRSLQPSDEEPQPEVPQAEERQAEEVQAAEQVPWQPGPNTDALFRDTPEIAELRQTMLARGRAHLESMGCEQDDLGQWLKK